MLLTRCSKRINLVTYSSCSFNVTLSSTKWRRSLRRRRRRRKKERRRQQEEEPGGREGEEGGGERREGERGGEGGGEENDDEEGNKLKTQEHTQTNKKQRETKKNKSQTNRKDKNKTVQARARTRARAELTIASAAFKKKRLGCRAVPLDLTMCPVISPDTDPRLNPDHNDVWTAAKGAPEKAESIARSQIWSYYALSTSKKYVKVKDVATENGRALTFRFHFYPVCSNCLWYACVNR